MRQLPTVRPPMDPAFDGDDFLAAPDIEAVAEDLRERHNLPPSLRIVYRWKRKGGKKGGAPTRGWCAKLGGPAKHFAGGADFLVWLGADTCREAGYTQAQYRALIYHELLFAGVEVDPETGEEKPIARRVDFEGFLEEIRDYGLWEDNLIAFAAEATQAPLFDPDAGPVPRNGRSPNGDDGLARADRAVARAMVP